jgi:hypothetical protein
MPVKKKLKSQSKSKPKQVKQDKDRINTVQSKLDILRLRGVSMRGPQDLMPPLEPIPDTKGSK